KRLFDTDNGTAACSTCNAQTQIRHPAALVHAAQSETACAAQTILVEAGAVVANRHARRPRAVADQLDDDAGCLAVLHGVVNRFLRNAIQVDPERFVVKAHRPATVESAVDAIELAAVFRQLL